MNMSHQMALQVARRSASQTRPLQTGNDVTVVRFVASVHRAYGDGRHKAGCLSDGERPDLLGAVSAETAIDLIVVAVDGGSTASVFQTGRQVLVADWPTVVGHRRTAGHLVAVRLLRHAVLRLVPRCHANVRTRDDDVTGERCCRHRTVSLTV